MENETKEKHATFTPGPWVVKHDKQGLPFIGVASDPWTYQGTVATVDTGEADARLIAAAPELYEQCKLFEKVLTHLINCGDFSQAGRRDKLREILAKVEGGECKHDHYETRTHPELGDQPFCPACDEFIEL